MLQVFRDMIRLQKEIEELQKTRQSLYNTVHSPSMTGTRNTTPTDPTARATEKIFAVDEMISQKIEERSGLAVEVMNWIYSQDTSSRLRRIIIHRFLMGESWKETAEAVESTEKAVKLMFYRSLRQIQKDNDP